MHISFINYGMSILVIVSAICFLSTKNPVEKCTNFTHDKPLETGELFYQGHISSGLEKLNSVFTPIIRTLRYCLDIPVIENSIYIGLIFMLFLKS